MNCNPVHAIPRKRLEVPEACGVQVTRSEDVIIVPPSPTATKFVAEAAIPLRLTKTLEDLVVHETPSEEVTIVPNAPTAATCDPEDATPNKEMFVPELTGAQVRVRAIRTLRA